MSELGYLLMYLFLVPLAVYINQRRTIKIHFEQGKPPPEAMQTKLADSVRRRHEKGGKNA